MAVIVLALFWFSLGGWFSTLVYYGVPMMKKYRFISAVWNFQRIFLLLLAGFGFDQILRDLRGQAAPGPAVFSKRARWVIAIVLACCVVDHVANGDRTFYTSTDFVFQGKAWPQLFERQAASLGFANKMAAVEKEIESAAKMQNATERKDRLEELGVIKEELLRENRLLLMGRYLIYAIVLGLAWLVLLNARPGAGGKASRLIGPMLLAVYLADVSFFFYQVMRQSPWCPPEVVPGEAFQVGASIYRPQRYEFSTMPADADRVCDIIKCPRGGSPEQNHYASQFVLIQCDLAMHGLAPGPDPARHQKNDRKPYSGG